jgi:hypothetical protein
LAFHGSIDSKSSTVRRCGNRAKSRDKYACGSMPFALQVSTNENGLALALAPATVSLRHDLRRKAFEPSMETIDDGCGSFAAYPHALLGADRMFAIP